MTMAQTLAQYRKLLTQEAELQKKQIDIQVEIRVCEKELEFSASSQPPADTSNQTDQFILTNRDNLEPEDMEFLQQPYRSTREVADHTGLSTTTLKRYGDQGQLRFKKTESGYRRWSTVSVMEYLINANPEEKA